MAESVGELIHRFIDEARSFIREEIALAKIELKHSAKECARDGAAMALGSAAALAGALVLIIGVALLFAWLISMAGLPLLLSSFLGFTAAGLMTAGTGAFLFFHGLNRLRRQTLAPEKSIEALRQFKGAAPEFSRPIQKTAAHSPAEEQQHRVLDAESSVHGALSQIKERLSPRAARARMARRVSEHRYALSAAAMSAGFLATLFVRRRRARA